MGMSASHESAEQETRSGGERDAIQQPSSFTPPTTQMENNVMNEPNLVRTQVVNPTTNTNEENAVPPQVASFTMTWTQIPPIQLTGENSPNWAALITQALQSSMMGFNTNTMQVPQNRQPGIEQNVPPGDPSVVTPSVTSVGGGDAIPVVIASSDSPNASTSSPSSPSEAATTPTPTTPDSPPTTQFYCYVCHRNVQVRRQANQQLTCCRCNMSFLEVLGQQQQQQSAPPTNGMHTTGMDPNMNPPFNMMGEGLGAFMQQAMMANLAAANVPLFNAGNGENSVSITVGVTAIPMGSGFQVPQPQDARNVMELFLNMVNQMPQPQPVSRRAKRTAVDALPRKRVAVGDTIVDCAICHEGVEMGQTLLSLDCAHGFHDECVLRWLDINNTCPTCRHELPREVPE